PGRGEISFTATVANPNLGQHRAQLRMGAYLPVLPPSALAWLARQNLALAALATAFVPAAAVMGLAMIDQRSRLALAQLRVRWLARFSF
ncbi:MAG TPA: hypothetical protein VD902_18065, partial [Symbiobacteriaceae bacterium]|nr:hypothetical protein [Symbiobacteriaceae bacterium]